VTDAAKAVFELTAVPMISSTLPVTARPACAISLSRLVPPNVASTRVAKPPNAANVAICRLPMTSYVSANSPGTTSVARTARNAAGFDQTGNHSLSIRETLTFFR
jgi:hypothetical protein